MAEALADGFVIVQEGRVLFPFDPKVKRTFAERCEGFKIGMLGTHAEPTWKSVYENRLFDDEVRWVHLRRDRRER